MLKQFIAGLVLASVSVLAPSLALAAEITVFAKIEGNQQGPFKGDSNRRDRKDWIEVSRFSYEVVSPRDASSGLPTGKRQHKPIILTKRYSANSPQILQALVTNEQLKTVILEFTRTLADGRTAVLQTIKLSNASFANFRQVSDSSGTIATELEDASLTFQTIELCSNLGNCTQDSIAQP